MAKEVVMGAPAWRHALRGAHSQVTRGSTQPAHMVSGQWDCRSDFFLGGGGTQGQLSGRTMQGLGDTGQEQRASYCTGTRALLCYPREVE